MQCHVAPHVWCGVWMVAVSFSRQIPQAVIVDATWTFAVTQSMQCHVAPHRCGVVWMVAAESLHIKSLEQRLLTRLGHWQSRKRGVRAGGKQKNNSRAANHSTWHQRSAAGRCSCAISTIKSETRAARRTHATETRAQCGIVIISDWGVVWCGVWRGPAAGSAAAAMADGNG